MVELLIQHGDKALLNLRDKQANQTPLMQAINHEHLKSAFALIDAGANPNLKDNGGKQLLITQKKRAIKSLSIGSKLSCQLSSS